MTMFVFGNFHSLMFLWIMLSLVDLQPLLELQTEIKKVFKATNETCCNLAVPSCGRVLELIQCQKLQWKPQVTERSQNDENNRTLVDFDQENITALQIFGPVSLCSFCV